MGAGDGGESGVATIPSDTAGDESTLTVLVSTSLWGTTCVTGVG